MARIVEAIARTGRGIFAALRARFGLALAVAAAVFAFNLVAPVALLSIARKPVDFFTFNPWLRRLPDYLVSPEPLAAKLAVLFRLTIAWASADAPDGLAWGFIVDVATLLRILCTSFVFGTYFALWSYRRQNAGSAARPAGVVGAATSVFGLTTCPCALAGCGAPILPVLSLAFSGLSSGALLVFAAFSRIGIAVLLAAMVTAILWFGWRAAGELPLAEAASVERSLFSQHQTMRN